jgi:hypothetical protein
VHAWADAIDAKIRALWPNIRLDVEMTRIAHRFAEQLAVGWTESTLWPSMENDLRSSERITAGKFIRAVTSLDEIDIPKLIGASDTLFLGDMGIGVVQTRRDGPQAGRIWVVVFYR